MPSSLRMGHVDERLGNGQNVSNHEISVGDDDEKQQQIIFCSHTQLTKTHPHTVCFDRQSATFTFVLDRRRRRRRLALLLNHPVYLVRTNFKFRSLFPSKQIQDGCWKNKSRSLQLKSWNKGRKRERVWGKGQGDEVRPIIWYLICLSILPLSQGVVGSFMFFDLFPLLKRTNRTSSQPKKKKKKKLVFLFLLTQVVLLIESTAKMTLRLVLAKVM